MTVDDKYRDTVNVIYEDYHFVKSAEDKRLYRGLELKNGMRVVLVSDVDTDKSSAALDVNIGSMSDPWELPGLAHFCEHMLFLGTEKYPDENSYEKFLKEHGGGSNAFTIGEHTNYHFSVNPQNLLQALDMFAQFFIGPLFTQSATDREVNAIQSEYDKNVQSDVWRFDQLDRRTSNGNHDYSKFGSGNIKSLVTEPGKKGINVREELLKFHSKYYSSNIMSLCVLGQESLDELTDMILPLFNKVPNKGVVVPEWNVHPYEGYLKTLAKIVPVKDYRSLNLSWPIPDQTEHYASHPVEYVSHLIGHEGSGSLLSELKRQGWCNSLASGHHPGAKGFMMFSISVDLTIDGLGHIDDIIKLVFQYIKMLRSCGIQEWVFKECQELDAMGFRFKDKERPAKLTTHLTEIMKLYPLQEVLSAPYLMQEYRPDLICKILKCLLPERVRIGVVSKEFEGQADLVEEWYGTQYCLQPISDAEIKAWTDCALNERLKLPAPNEFVPSNFDLVKDETKEQLPHVVRQNQFCRLWYKQDTKYLLPKACMSFEIRTQLGNMNPIDVNLSYMFVELLKDELNEYAYAAEIADLSYHLIPTFNGLQFSIKGYNDKQHVLVRKIVEKMVKFVVSPQRFDILKELYERNLKSFEMAQPRKHADYYMNLLLRERGWTKQDLLAALNDVTVERVNEFSKYLLSRIFIEGLIYGNINQQGAVDVMDLIVDVLREKADARPLFSDNQRGLREVQLPDGCHYTYTRPISVQPSSCVMIYFQTGMQGTVSNVLLELLCQIISEPCFNTLRTQEQLGYIVFSSPRRSNGIQGLQVVVQSDKHPNYVDMRIESFLLKMRNLLNEMSDEDFSQHIESLISEKLEEPKKLSGKHSQYWGEIISQQYNFDRENIEVEELRLVKKCDLLKFYNDAIAIDSERRHKLSVHVLSQSTSPVDESDGVDFADALRPVAVRMKKRTAVEDIVKFKKNLYLYPLLEPYIQLPSGDI